MGLFDAAMKRLQQATKGVAATKSAAQKPAWGGRDPNKANYGKAGAPAPDLDALVTDAEIEAVTGASPEGEPRRNGPDGSDNDLGRQIIRESTLSNGDKFLISLGNCSGPSAAQLAMDRMAEYEKPLAGVGERALVRVKKYPKKGSSEISVTALHENFTVALCHTSTAGRTDPEPLAQLVKKVLTRL